MPYRLTVITSLLSDPAIRTLILTDRQTLEALYSPAEVADLFAALDAVAAHERVQGVIVDDLSDPGETNAAVVAAYDAWLGAPVFSSPQHANGFAAALHDWIWAQRDQNYPALRYVLIVGDDRVLPFARITIPAAADPAWVGEQDYRDGEGLPYLATDSPTGYALNENYTLSDDFYGTQTPIDLGGRSFHLPDVAVGRLVESPAQMTAQIDSFLAQDGILQINEALAAGYDFMEDAVQELADALRGEGVTVTELRGSQTSWTAAQLEDELNTSPRDLLMLGVHAEHFDHGAAAGGPWLRADDIIHTPANTPARLVLIFRKGKR